MSGKLWRLYFKAATTTISDKGNNKRSRAPETDKALRKKPKKPTKKKIETV
ncbi:hypothetical protein L915_06560 [Phytophthora nicotianae]|uniref:Uncharacterized protein n=1 Tax=Phytophthora nicotianae TaxID=4792 RepID=W2H4B7_PHYNI|nr:hypothetical protein L915_06560 [Phytophthora nicotianae]